MSEDYTKAEVEFKAKSSNAVLIAVDGEEFWIPRSLLSYRSDTACNSLSRGDEFTIELMTWKAIQIGLG